MSGFLGFGGGFLTGGGQVPFGVFADQTALLANVDAEGFSEGLYDRVAAAIAAGRYRESLAQQIRDGAGGRGGHDP
ncbi:MAG: hypothetical protein EOM21_20635 [Gammaproteobacteria bacterium]|nr:hypothetical protein [Gammaproteobacteria bacterium]